MSMRSATIVQESGTKNGRRAPRSRTGCKRCKERRFKCDEEKPQCGRCQSAGVSCPGYGQSLKWSTKHEVFPSKKRRTLSSASLLDSPSLINRTLSPVQQLPTESEQHVEETARLEQDPTVRGSSITPGSRQGSISTPGQPLSTQIGSDFLELPEIPQMSPTSLYISQLNFDIAPDVEVVDPLDFFQIPAKDEEQPQKPLELVTRQSWLPNPSRGPSDFSSALVEYYFKETAGVFSCYDSRLNPFRTTVADFWTQSPALHRTLQSMAAACLVNENPYFKTLCRKLRSEAMSFLYNDPSQDEKSLLALLMLGQTSSWFDPQDLGVPLFKALRSKLSLSAEPSAQTQLIKAGVDRSFFEQALEYWEMLLSFVSSDLDPEMPNGPFSSFSKNMRKVPHPWTGVCRETQMLVNQVGQLARSERMRIRSEGLSGFSWQHSIDRSTSSFQLAQYLEMRLKNLSEPTEEGIISPGDTETPVWHLQAVAEVYRRTGLINLYRVFPDLLIPQLNFSNPQAEISPSDNWLSLVNDSSLHDTTDQQTTTYQEWLTNFAVETLEIMETIPATSRTRCLQPFMLVVCASELRTPPWIDEAHDQIRNVNQNPDISLGQSTSNLFNSTINSSNLHDSDLLSHSAFTPLSPTSHPFGFHNSGDPSVSHSTCTPSTRFATPAQSHGQTQTDEEQSNLSQTFRVMHARRFVRGRLNLFMNVLPPRPTKTCLDLVEAVWDRLDENGGNGAFWIDVMLDKGLHTTMG
ncbi:hypothetical protein PV10_07373 [Exophiala mesophila]|uniref:Zn(2)-C6 fungal-type domain-containing protein n=1 Tax=Exophiala mesophila TaxID=212818 RepID=A0A0D1Z5G0_EXOME|nr:uncharacterized protein PV10_07373 [Exophiala mesophila]KIV90027.1 hypothetical protein PV10_07373 [Exophiala mesophila]